VLLGVDDPWAPSIDHVVPLFEGGRDMESNMRAAHKLCNNHAARRSGQSIARLCPGLGELLEKITRNS
jgi:5-methylcytosine-specific restriction endonuclease McrA